jgi:hypothetical protein
MNQNLLLGAALIAGPLAASAQTTVLDYQTGSLAANDLS